MSEPTRRVLKASVVRSRGGWVWNVQDGDDTLVVSKHYESAGAAKRAMQQVAGAAAEGRLEMPEVLMATTGELTSRKAGGAPRKRRPQSPGDKVPSPKKSPRRIRRATGSHKGPGASSGGQRTRATTGVKTTAVPKFRPGSKLKAHAPGERKDPLGATSAPAQKTPAKKTPSKR